MSTHHQHRHNSNLARAIRAQTGMAAFPYMEYSPVNYQAQYNAYAGAYGASNTLMSPISGAPSAATVDKYNKALEDAIGTFAPKTEDEGGGDGSNEEEEDTGEQTGDGDSNEESEEGADSMRARNRRRRRLRAGARNRFRRSRVQRNLSRQMSYGEAAAAAGGVDPVSAAITGLASLIGVGVKTAVTASQSKRMQDAEHAAQEQRLRLELASNERSLAAQYAAQANAAVGGHGKTILISLGVLGVLGGGLYFILRKKKK